MSKNVKLGLQIAVAILFALAMLFGLSRSDVKLFGYQFGDSKKITDSGDPSLENIYQTAQQASGQATTTTASFLAVGDIMLSRSVAGAIAYAKDPLLPFSHTQELLQATNFNFGNLESPLSGRGDFNSSSGLAFNAPPQDVVGLKTNNFQIINLANNHAFDQGLTGIDFTRQYLDGQGVAHIGTGDTLDEAWQPQIITANGIKIGFIGASYSSANDGGASKNNYVARIEDTARLQQAITALKQQADFVVVSMHAGIEYTRTPDAEQIAFAHAAIDDGADMVIGAHPHWIQPIEQYNGKYIFYSLGNFIFDQEWSQDTKEGLTVKITLQSSKVANAAAPGAASIDDLQGSRLGATITRIELVPVILEHYSTPRLATPTEAANILKKINSTNPIVTP